MKLSIVVAVAENNVIGNNNQLIWRMPTDLKRFKTLTMGHPIIMGRKTYESIGKALPGRTSIIITRQADYQAADCIVVHSLDEAIKAAKSTNTPQAFVIGGAEIYHQALAICDTVYLTKIKHSFHGDAVFPNLDQNKWELVNQEEFLADEKNPYPYQFLTLNKRVN
jgi:dihydrofolate reductase